MKIINADAGVLSFFGINKLKSVEEVVLEDSRLTSFGLSSLLQSFDKAPEQLEINDVWPMTFNGLVDAVFYSGVRRLKVTNVAFSSNDVMQSGFFAYNHHQRLEITMQTGEAADLEEIIRNDEDWLMIITEPASEPHFQPKIILAHI